MREDTDNCVVRQSCDAANASQTDAHAYGRVRQHYELGVLGRFVLG